MTNEQKQDFIKLVPHSTIHQLFKYAKLNNYDFDIILSLILQCGFDYVLDEKLNLNLPE